MKTKLVSGMVLLALLSGCAAAPLTPGKPVEEKYNFFTGKTFHQEGQLIDKHNLLEHLRSNPATQDKANAARTWEIISLFPAVTGGFLIGWYAFNDRYDDDSQMVGLLAGAGLAAVGIGMAVHAENLFSDAVGIYNRDLSGKKADLLLQPALFSSRNSVAPTLVPGVMGSWRLP
jgi:hypothetical protein